MLLVGKVKNIVREIMRKNGSLQEKMEVSKKKRKTKKCFMTRYASCKNG